METYKDLIQSIRMFFFHVLMEEQKFMSKYVYEILSSEVQSIDHELKLLDKKLVK